jgi:peroxiredoxin
MHGACLECKSSLLGLPVAVGGIRFTVHNTTHRVRFHSHIAERVLTVTDIGPGAPLVGHPAPDLSLPSTAGREVSLAAFRGDRNVLLAFFPLAFTSTCTAQMRCFTDDFAQFQRTGTAVLPISVDSIPTLREFKAKYGYTLDFLSDFRREASRRYGVLLEDRFFSKRAYFLIDRAGVLRWRHVEAELGSKRDDAELLEQIATLA